jgi:hypothetical protein
MIAAVAPVNTQQPKMRKLRRQRESGADHLSAETHAAFAFAATILWHDH